ncbi:MAG: hypothetical protein D6767_02860 [Candidatus Hydrogenedentota bacterium]|nr:MAG: hypothetical protein D6767_02860 [Candidatus Hydrogenedentota bacterium]
MKVVDLTIPDIGDADSIELIQWNFKEGETFAEGDEICDLVTDKATFSLEAPSAGVIQKILIPAKSKVEIGQKAAILEIQEDA